MSSTASPVKIPFDYGLFFCAVKNLLGEPVRQTDLTDKNGYYDWYWEFPKDRVKKTEVTSNMHDIAKWINYFDVHFPGSRCDVARWDESPNPKLLYLRITILHTRAREKTE